jgi:hypothetical protein
VGRRACCVSPRSGDGAVAMMQAAEHGRAVDLGGGSLRSADLVALSLPWCGSRSTTSSEGWPFGRGESAGRRLAALPNGRAGRAPFGRRRDAPGR